MIDPEMYTLQRKLAINCHSFIQSTNFCLNIKQLFNPFGSNLTNSVNQRS